MSIITENLSYTYGKGTSTETVALKNVSLSIEDGEFVALMGHTGCGKSTFLQLVAGLITPTSGRVFVDGVDINDHKYDRSILRKKLGVVFQYPESQLFETTVWKDVAFGLKHLDIDREERENCIRRALETVGFDYEEIKGKSPLGLSGGEKRLVAIAGVLAVKPKILFFDEPIAGLDPAGRDRLMDILRDLNQKNITVIMISHNADYISEYASRVIALKSGEVVIDEEIHSAFSDSERLRKYRIGMSQSREIVEKLNLRGWNISGTTISYDSLLAALTDRLGGNGDGT